MRTLVISDLHLGARTGRDVLRRPAALARLCDALTGADRLVLLGDTVEMLEGRPWGALSDAEPVLRAIGEALGERPVVMVPGNHDHRLVQPWLRDRRHSEGPLGVSPAVPSESGRALAEIARWLRPARLEVRYPTVELAPGVWAHHGHYLDRHLVRQPRVGSRATPEDYEGAVGPRAARLAGGAAASMPAFVGKAVDRAARIAAHGAVMARPLVASMPGADLLAPLSAGALGYQMRRSGLPAMASVVDGLAIDATDVIFGHVHRAGPRLGDDRTAWELGGRRYWNTGCWVYEPLLLARATPPHPYWPGGAIWIEGDAIESVGLLDGLDPRELR